MKWKIIFNPFEKFSEIQLLIVGILTNMLGSILFWMFGQSSDGIFHIASNADISLATAFAENSAAVVLITLLLFILGRIINPKTRGIDILNVALIHRIPFFITGVINAVPFVRTAISNVTTEAMKGNNFSFSVTEMLLLFVFGIISLLLLAYCITLLVNGFKTAVHTKKLWHYIAFALVVFIVSEIIYRVFIHQYLLTL